MEDPISRMKYVPDGVRYLLQKVKTLLEVVLLSAPPQARVLNSQLRQAEIEVVCALAGQARVVSRRFSLPSDDGLSFGHGPILADRTSPIRRAAETRLREAATR